MVPCCCAFLLQASSRSRQDTNQAIPSTSPRVTSTPGPSGPANKSGCHAHAEDCPEIGFHDDTLCSGAQRSHTSIAIVFLGECPRCSLSYSSHFFNLPYHWLPVRPVQVMLAGTLWTLRLHLPQLQVEVQTQVVHPKTCHCVWQN